MGMSNDYEVAVEEGATIVRLGSALSGPYKEDSDGWRRLVDVRLSCTLGSRTRTTDTTTTLRLPDAFRRDGSQCLLAGSESASQSKVKRIRCATAGVAGPPSDFDEIFSRGRHRPDRTASMSAIAFLAAAGPASEVGSGGSGEPQVKVHLVMPKNFNDAQASPTSTRTTSR